MKKILSLVLMAALAACSGNSDTAKTDAKPMTMTAKDTVAVAAPKYTADMVVNKKDFSCGMPLSAGLEDTCHYKGKAYGFCSKECKEAFLKDPGRMLEAMK